ncbi:unnamed protein product, partial [Medioppia subpectinata]
MANVRLVNHVVRRGGPCLTATTTPAIINTTVNSTARRLLPTTTCVATTTAPGVGQHRRHFYSYCNEPTHPIPQRQPKWMSPEEALSVVKSGEGDIGISCWVGCSVRPLPTRPDLTIGLDCRPRLARYWCNLGDGDHVFVHGAAATPRVLVPALAAHGKKAGLKNVRVHHIHTEGAGEYNAPEYKDIFRSNSLFTGGNCREPINAGRADFTPIFLGDIPKLFYKGIIKPDVALIQVTPADKHGYHSLGTSVDCVRAALQHTKYIIGQVNPRFPRTSGHAIIHTSHFDALVEGELPIPEHKTKGLTDVEKT